MVQQGYLVITDITGYSSYIKDSELEHARDSLAALLRLLIEQTRSPFAIAKLEGDAVFSYAPDGAFLQGQSMLEMMEGTYVAFRRALELMIFNTSCPCNACRNLPNLDLKIFVHFGKFDVQEMGPYKELIGNDVNLLHRLLKNKISETLRLRAYAAYTQAVIDHLQLSAFCKEMLKHSEAFADVGEVQLYVQDMHGVWEKKREGTRIEVKSEEALNVFTHDYPIPPAQLWEYITLPETRALFMGVEKQEVEKETVRNGEETVYLCYHGQGTALHTIVDWRPFEQYTTNESLIGKIAMYATYKLEPIESGTRFSLIWGKPRGIRFITKQVEKNLLSKYVPTMPEMAARLEKRIQKDINAGKLAFMPSTRIDQAQLQNAVAESLSR